VTLRVLRRFTRLFGSSTQEPIHDPHHHAQHDTQDDARRNWEEERGVLAAVVDVAGQTSKRNADSVGEEYTEANHDQ